MMVSQKNACSDASYSILQNYVRNIVQQRGWTGTESAANDDLTRLNNLLSHVDGILLNVFPDGSIHSIYGLWFLLADFNDNFRSDGNFYRVLKRRNQQYLRIIRNVSLFRIIVSWFFKPRGNFISILNLLKKTVNAATKCDAFWANISPSLATWLAARFDFGSSLLHELLFKIINFAFSIASSKSFRRFELH